MKTSVRVVLTAILGALALSASSGALAHERHKYDKHPGHGWGHSKHRAAHHRHRAISQPVVIYRPAPVYYERRVYHYSPPAIVIGVAIPPLVVPLR